MSWPPQPRVTPFGPRGRRALRDDDLELLGPAEVGRIALAPLGRRAVRLAGGDGEDVLGPGVHAHLGDGDARALALPRGRREARQGPRVSAQDLRRAGELVRGGPSTAGLRQCRRRPGRRCTGVGWPVVGCPGVGCTGAAGPCAEQLVIAVSAVPSVTVTARPLASPRYPPGLPIIGSPLPTVISVTPSTGAAPGGVPRGSGRDETETAERRPWCSSARRRPHRSARERNSAQTSATRRSRSSRVPELSMTMSAMASRCSRVAWAAIRARA